MSWRKSIKAKPGGKVEHSRIQNSRWTNRGWHKLQAYEQRKVGNFRNGGPLGIRPGAKTTTPPLAKLVSGKKYIVEGQRLAVNASVDRYKREMANLDEKQYGDKCRYRGNGPNQPEHQKESFPVHQPTYGPGLWDGYFPLGRAKIKLGAGV
jgi:hypothetical protein